MAELSLEQCKRLKEAGFPQGSQDYGTRLLYRQMPDDEYPLEWNRGERNVYDYDTACPNSDEMDSVILAKAAGFAHEDSVRIVTTTWQYPDGVSESQAILYADDVELAKANTDGGAVNAKAELICTLSTQERE